MATKLKNADAQRVGYGKLYNECDFGTEGFVDQAAMYFKGSEVVDATEAAKSALNKLSSTFSKLAKEYKNILKTCGTDRGLFDSNDIDEGSQAYKDLTKFVKKLNNRATYCKDRIKTIENAIDVARIETINVGTKRDAAIKSAVDKATIKEKDS